ncbi:MAG: phosphocholine cytidylyltransferase family protein, partial [Treponema sp.]|nr:phosphocholine cytidylyltransferase family protein [Treponema sp.]
MIRQAVIVAGGMGTRLKEMTDFMPKGFIELGGVPIVEQSVRKLFAAGVEEIVIGTGHCAEWYERLAARYPGLVLVKNERYAATGSMGTLACCAPLVKGDFLLLESDLIYDSVALHALINESHRDALLASGPTSSGDEVWLLADTEGWLLRNSKNKAEIPHPAGELVGITRLRKETLDRMLAHREAHLEDQPRMEYEAAMSAVSSAAVAASRSAEGPSAAGAGGRIFIRKIEYLLWREIDDENHLAAARDLVYPRIAEAEKL